MAYKSYFFIYKKLFYLKFDNRLTIVLNHGILCLRKIYSYCFNNFGLGGNEMDYKKVAEEISKALEKTMYKQLRIVQHVYGLS